MNIKWLIVLVMGLLCMAAVQVGSVEIDTCIDRSVVVAGGGDPVFVRVEELEERIAPDWLYANGIAEFNCGLLSLPKSVNRYISRTTDRQCITSKDIFCGSQWQTDWSVVRKVI
jgi:hypothetical protein